MKAAEPLPVKLCRLSVLFMLRAACLLDIAVTFGSVAGLRMARACSTGESNLSLGFVFD